MKNTIKIARYVNGYPVYDCSIFGGDGVQFKEDVYVTGDIFLGDNSRTRIIQAGGNIVLGDNAKTWNIKAGANITLGDNAKVLDIKARKDIIFNGKAKICNNISAGNHIIFEP